MTYKGGIPLIGILMLTVACQSDAATASVRIVANIAEVISVSVSGTIDPVVDIQTNSPQSFDITTQRIPADSSSATALVVEISAR